MSTGKSHHQRKRGNSHLLRWSLLLISCIVNAPVLAEDSATDSPKILSGRIIIDENVAPTTRASGGISSTPNLVYLQKKDLEICSVFEMVQGKENAAAIYARFAHLEKWLAAHPELCSLAEQLKQANADPIGIPNCAQ